MSSLVQIARELSDQASALKFKKPVAYVYNPLEYARAPWEKYLQKYGNAPKRVLFLGMNPGPFGMAQTGVPFGDVSMVRDWLGIESKITSPSRTHPKRPVQGFECTRSEVSGTRFWGWAKKRFGTPEVFFADHFVWNYCPLVFMEASGRNRTPDQLPSNESEAVKKICRKALLQIADHLNVRQIVAIGRYAEHEAKTCFSEKEIHVHYLLHPSPMSPAANSNWDENASSVVRLLQS